MRIVATFLFLTCCLAASESKPVMTPAETSIQKAEQQIAKSPGHYAYYNELAMACARRSREISDVSYYAKAEEALKQSFAIAPDNFEGLKVRTWLLLGGHEFAAALESATKLNAQNPDDVTVYGYLVDANAELGNYAEAVKAAQWMLNLRPGNVAGLTRAAYLRELHGDLSGAAELMQMAYDATAFHQFEDRAWLLVQLAHIALLSGDLARAEGYSNSALELFPGYHYALGVLGQIRMAQKRYGDAVKLFQQRYEAAAHAENLYALAEAYERAGESTLAATAYSEFERKAVAESGIADNANHELIAYYCDVAKKPQEALRIAREELKRRHDVFTLDSYAWALAASGDYPAAARQIRKALATGIKDPNIARHAETIAAHLPGGSASERAVAAGY